MSAAARSVPTSFAFAAVLSAPSGALKASSWSTLGEVSYEKGNYDVAVPASRSALDQGASDSATEKQFKKARAGLGASPQVELSTQYLGERANGLFETIYNNSIVEDAFKREPHT